MLHARVFALITGGLMCLTALLVGGCSKNAATGKNIFTLGMSRNEEIALGTQAAPGMVQQMGGKVQKPELQAYVTTVGRSLAAQTEADNPTLPWEFTLLDADEVNAFALPGGKVFIAKGLAKRMTNEAQLAAVLGHEIGHVTARHTAQRVSQQTVTSLGVSAAAAVLSRGSTGVRTAGELAINVGGTLVPLKFSRDQESEADALGVRYMTKLNYNPLGARQVMEILLEASAGGRQPEFLATHPDPQHRIDNINGMLAGQYKNTQNNPQYQLYEERFQSQFKSKLAEGPESAPTRLALGGPMTWCAHCRFAAFEN